MQPQSQLKSGSFVREIMREKIEEIINRYMIEGIKFSPIEEGENLYLFFESKKDAITEWKDGDKKTDQSDFDKIESQNLNDEFIYWINLVE